MNTINDFKLNKWFSERLYVHVLVVSNDYFIAKI